MNARYTWKNPRWVKNHGNESSTIEKHCTVTIELTTQLRILAIDSRTIAESSFTVPRA